jgi:hypothetical protein
MQTEKPLTTQKISQLELIQDRLDDEESRYSSAITEILNQQKEELATERAETQNIFDTYISAMGAGITDTAVLASIKNAKTANEAMEIYAKNSPKVTSASISDQLKAAEAGYSIVDGQIVPQAKTSQTVTDASGATYDIGTYATDPTHEAKIQSILDNMGQMTSIQQMDSYIQSVLLVVR